MKTRAKMAMDSPATGRESGSFAVVAAAIAWAEEQVDEAGSRTTPAEAALIRAVLAYTNDPRLSEVQPVPVVVPDEPPVEEVDWSRFVPKEEIVEDMKKVAYRDLARGDVFASWDLICGGNVNRCFGVDRARRIAGRGAWWQRRIRLIRHADGRWADGYTKDGPVIKPSVRDEDDIQERQ